MSENENPEPAKWVKMRLVIDSTGKVVGFEPDVDPEDQWYCEQLARARQAETDSVNAFNYSEPDQTDDGLIPQLKGKLW